MDHRPHCEMQSFEQKNLCDLVFIDEFLDLKHNPWKKKIATVTKILD